MIGNSVCVFMQIFSFLPPVVQKTLVKIHKSTENIKNLLFKVAVYTLNNAQPQEFLVLFFLTPSGSQVKICIPWTDLLLLTKYRSAHTCLETLRQKQVLWSSIHTISN